MFHELEKPCPYMLIGKIPKADAESGKSKIYGARVIWNVNCLNIEERKDQMSLIVPEFFTEKPKKVEMRRKKDKSLVLDKEGKPLMVDDSCETIPEFVRYFGLADLDMDMNAVVRGEASLFNSESPEQYLEGFYARELEIARLSEPSLNQIEFKAKFRLTTTAIKLDWVRYINQNSKFTIKQFREKSALFDEVCDQTQQLWQALLDRNDPGFPSPLVYFSGLRGFRILWVDPELFFWVKGSQTFDKLFQTNVMPHYYCSQLKLPSSFLDKLDSSVYERRKGVKPDWKPHPVSKLNPVWIALPDLMNDTLLVQDLSKNLCDKISNYWWRLNTFIPNKVMVLNTNSVKKKAKKATENELDEIENSNGEEAEEVKPIKKKRRGKAPVPTFAKKAKINKFEFENAVYDLGELVYSKEIEQGSDEKDKEENDEEEILNDVEVGPSYTWKYMLKRHLSSLPSKYNFDIEPASKLLDIDVCKKLKDSNRWVVTLANYTWCELANRHHSEPGKVYFVFMVPEGFIIQKCHSNRCREPTEKGKLPYKIVFNVLNQSQTESSFFKQLKQRDELAISENSCESFQSVQSNASSGSVSTMGIGRLFLEESQSIVSSSRNNSSNGPIGEAFSTQLKINDNKLRMDIKWNWRKRPVTDIDKMGVELAHEFKEVLHIIRPVFLFMPLEYKLDTVVFDIPIKDWFDTEALATKGSPILYYIVLYHHKSRLAVECGYLRSKYITVDEVSQTVQLRRDKMLYGPTFANAVKYLELAGLYPAPVLSHRGSDVGPFVGWEEKLENDPDISGFKRFKPNESIDEIPMEVRLKERFIQHINMRSFKNLSDIYLSEYFDDWDTVRFKVERYRP